MPFQSVVILPFPSSFALSLRFVVIEIRKFMSLIVLDMSSSGEIIVSVNFES